MKNEKTKLDSIDLKILSELQQNDKTSNVELANIVKIVIILL